MAITFIRRDELPRDVSSRDFVGEQHGNAGACVIFFEGQPGEMAVVDANQPHGFVNSGDGVLRQIDVHLSPRSITEWLG